MVDRRQRAASLSEPGDPTSGVNQEEPLNSIRTFEDLLADLERCVQDAGRLWLFSGEDLRLDVMLLRHEKSPQVIWGLKRHEDWVFKATLLRFARDHCPVHLILTAEKKEAGRVRGWVVQRTMDAFWASPLPAGCALRLWKQNQAAPELMGTLSTGRGSMYAGADLAELGD